MDWLPTIVSSIVAVVVSAAFTWFFNLRTERRRRLGIRALLAQELMQNETTVRVLLGELKRIESGGSVGYIVSSLQRRTKSIPWQTSRWLLPGVGIAFSPTELTELTEWYVKLDHLTYLHHSLVDSVDLIAEKFKAQRAIPEGTANALKGFLKAAIDFAEGMLTHKPKLPDARLHQGRDMKVYVQNLVRRAIDEGVAFTGVIGDDD